VDRVTVNLLTVIVRLFGMNRWIFVFVFGLLAIGFVSGAKVDKSILEKFDEGENRVAVIVEKNILRERGLKSMNSVNHSIRKISERGNKYTAFVTEEELKILKSDFSVSEVRRNIPLKVFMQDSVGIVGVNNSWNLKIDGINLTGGSQSVCILDTGIDIDHPDFAGRILAQKCFCEYSDYGGGGCCPDTTTEDNNASDDDGHGTHVAGIVGANGGISGIATDVGLVVVKIMDNNGDGSSSDFEDGLQWCIDNAATYNISVITASLGAATKKTSSCDADVNATTSIINAAVAAGISVTVATGNDGWDDGITWPSCISSATPVGAVSKSDVLWYNRNSLLKLLGIGRDVNSTDYLGSYEERGGTSMATPMVAGAISVLNQVLSLTSQSKTPSEIEDIFYDTGETISELGNNYSRINLYDAILSIDNIAPNVSLVSPNDDKISLLENQTFVCNATDWQLGNVTLKIWNSSVFYYNETVNLTGISNETSFNVTGMFQDNYNWSCEIYDLQNNFATASNYSIVIAGSEVTLNSPSNGTYTNVNETNFNCTARSDSDYGLSNLTFYLWNSSYLIYNETVNISGVENETIFNYTFENESDYLWSCFVVNNNSNENFAERNYSITYDATAPVISGVSASVTVSSATITWTTDEIANSSVSLEGTSSAYEANHSVVISGLASSTIYTYNVTSCDRADNCNVSEGNSFTTSAAVVTPGGGTSTSTGGANPKSHIVEESEISDGKSVSFKLRKNEKIIFNVSSVGHELRVLGVNTSSVKILVESEPIEFMLFAGQEKKINFTSPYYYNLLVKLNSIGNNQANVTIMKIYEETGLAKIVRNGSIIEEGDEVAEVKEKWINYRKLWENSWITVFLIIATIFLVVSFLNSLTKKPKKLKVLRHSKRRRKHGRHKKAKVKTVGKR